MGKVLDTYRLKVAMQLKGVNARQLAEQAGVAESTIHQYTCGARQPNLEHFARICKALDIADAGALLKIEDVEAEAKNKSGKLDKDAPDE